MVSVLHHRVRADLWKLPGTQSGRSDRPCCDRIFVVLAPFEALTAPWSDQPNRYVDEERAQVGGGKGLTLCLCKRAHEGERVGGQLFHHALSTAHEHNGTWTTTFFFKKKEKNAVRLPYHAGLCCNRCIAILSALRACETWSIANPGSQTTVFFSRRKSTETVMVTVLLDVLKQYFVKWCLQDDHKVYQRLFQCQCLKT